MEASRVLICSHGRAMRSLVCTMLGQELKEMTNYPHGNLSLYIFRQEKGTFRMLKKNVTDHLHEAG
jgi:probable phosphoglycerate mutase